MPRWAGGTAGDPKILGAWDGHLRSYKVISWMFPRAGGHVLICGPSPGQDAFLLPATVIVVRVRAPS